MEIDSEGSPHLAFGDQDSIYYAERVGDTWEQTSVLGSENSLYNGHVVLRLDEIDDAPTLVFWQPDQPGSGTVRIASPDFTDIQPGDANRDGEFNQLDLLQALRNGRFRNGEAATWEDGDWDGAPNGRLARPPEGNGVFDNQDLITALAADQWLAGSYLTDDNDSVAGEPPVDYENGEVHASKLLTTVSLLYDPSSGSLVLDTDESTLLSSINIDSESGLFDGELAIQLGEFDTYTPGNLFKATFSEGFGDLDFGKALLPGLSAEQLLGDLQITGSYASGGFLENVNVQVVPEPSSSTLLAIAMSFLGLLRIRRSR